MADSHSPPMVIICADGQGVPISFQVGADGKYTVSALRLHLRFQFLEGSMHVDEDIFDVDSGELLYTIGQESSMNDQGQCWILKSGTYRVYGLKDLLQGASTEILTPKVSSTCTLQTPMLQKVKIEPCEHTVHLLSDDSEDELPTRFPSSNIPIPNPTVTCHTSHDTNSSQGSRPSTSRPPIPPRIDDYVSVVDCLKKLAARKGSKSILSKVDFTKIKTERVEFLPPMFDGDVMFELPPPGKYASQSQAKLLYGMDKRHDGHAWTRTITSNIKNDMGLTFRMSSCLGHLQCTNTTCDYLSRVHRSSQANETEWDGISLFTFGVGCTPPKGSTVVCKICKVSPSCLDVCLAKIYYVLGHGNMTRACVHLGSHCHPVKIGEYRDVAEKIKTLIGEQVEKTPTATNSAIVLEASKEFLGELLLFADGSTQEELTLDELIPVFDKFKHMSSPSIRNQVTTFRYLRRFGVMDSITKLRGSSYWAFVQENKFPGQGSESDKVFVFKMSEVGPGSGVDLVTRMQPGGDLQNAWIMFDHVKRVKDWTSMACHVYDATYCRVMTIAVCDMQSEDVAAQIIFWNNLNAVVARHNVSNVQFKGFMADSAQANWNAIRIVYGSGDASIPMEDQERTCLFHWTQSLEKHTKADIRADLQPQHRQLCMQYKNAKSLEEAEERYLAIRSWWLSSGATTDEGVVRLDLWLAFWHFRYRQWGGFMDLVGLHFAPGLFAFSFL